MSESTATATPTTRVPKGERKKQILDLHAKGMRPCEIAKELGIARAYVSQAVRLAHLRGEAANRPSVGYPAAVVVFADLVSALSGGNLQAAATLQTELRERGWDVRPVARQHMNATTTNA